jgi:hypothetical protein
VRDHEPHRLLDDPALLPVELELAIQPGAFMGIQLGEFVRIEGIWLAPFPAP